MFTITFYGATKNVTGSRHFLNFNGRNFLIDCGIYQEREFLSRNWQDFPVKPSSIDAVFLTHAHLDHCGFLPCIVRDGFKGKIFATRPTIEIAKIALIDAAKLYEEDAEKKRRRHQLTGKTPAHPEVPLFTTEDAYDVFDLFQEIPCNEKLDISDGLMLICHNAGHILGSVIFEFIDKKTGKNLVFTGDLGRPARPLLPEPERLEKIDYLVVESTYGDRIHEPDYLSYEKIAQVISWTAKNGGNIVVPSFAIERTQEFLYCLKKLLQQNKIPHLMIFIDSPMAIKVTEVFKRYPEFLRQSLIALDENPFEMDLLHPTETVEQSKSINHVKGSVIIIAGSGMCTGGRIKHHLASNIGRKESTIMFIGYQAQGTLGREIISGKTEVRILGEMKKVMANIVQVNGFSSHADQSEILWWLSSLKKPPINTFLVHGENNAIETLKKTLFERKSIDATIAQYQMTVRLE
ncbi:MAG: MBL fold metallo-hydrolase [Candidatus Omnitrophica bacterium]|nr:MBL fold metallo-hydrolase [Candidatus Omnitrophota bacterium]MCM8828494.1 MBL fold metallo-hydrolase [Candidatus Omnitrophota bacterium]